mmetsp:Transcript_3079/g.7945  ORF Transcript_3079/g.7945 Transcript_3079/m.7945 type:complete len:257 (-) Transcript_3079:1246-2016(-)
MQRAALSIGDLLNDQNASARGEIEEEEEGATAVHAAEIFQCYMCKTSSTPVRRSGPLGENELCNACGLKWARQQRKRKTTETAVGAQVMILGSSEPDALQYGVHPSRTLPPHPPPLRIPFAGAPQHPLSSRLIPRTELTRSNTFTAPPRGPGPSPFRYPPVHSAPPGYPHPHLLQKSVSFDERLQRPSSFSPLPFSPASALHSSLFASPSSQSWSTPVTIPRPSPVGGFVSSPSPSGNAFAFPDGSQLSTLNWFRR